MNRTTWTWIALCGVAVLGLSSCANTTAKELAGGKRDFVAQRYDASFKKIQRAAEAGDPDAEYALGYMYYYGKGTDQDTQAAKSWISKAAAQGQSQAIRAQQMLEKAEHPDMASIRVEDAGNNGVAAQPALPQANSLPAAVPAGGKSARAVTPVAQTTPPAVPPPLPGATAASPADSGRGAYTLQLIGVSREAAAKDFIRRYSLGGQAVSVRTNRNGADWYVVTYGAYATPQAARKAIDGLPLAVQRLKPWPRKIPQTL